MLSCIVRQMVVRSLHEVVQQVVDSQGDIARALCAAEQFSHDSGCTAVFILFALMLMCMVLFFSHLHCYCKQHGLHIDSPYSPLLSPSAAMCTLIHCHNNNRSTAVIQVKLC